MGRGARHVGVEGEADGRRWGASSGTRTAVAGVHRCVRAEGSPRRAGANAGGGYGRGGEPTGPLQETPARGVLLRLRKVVTRRMGPSQGGQRADAVRMLALTIGM